MSGLSTVMIRTSACRDSLSNDYGEMTIAPLAEDKACNFTVNAWDIELALNGETTDPYLLFFKAIMKFLWVCYQYGVITAAWVADTVFQMTWVRFLLRPFRNLELSIEGILADIDVYAAMLTVSAFVCVIWMARGLWKKGLLQLLVSLVVVNYAVAAATGASASPLDVIMGPGYSQSGLLFDTQDAAEDVAHRLAEDQNPESETQIPVSHPGQAIIETFLYRPAMITNFGTTLGTQNGIDCEKLYVATLDAAGKNTWAREFNDNDLIKKHDLDGFIDNKRELEGWKHWGLEFIKYTSVAGGFIPEGFGKFHWSIRTDPHVWSAVGRCMVGEDKDDGEEFYSEVAGTDSLAAQAALGVSVMFLLALVMAFAGMLFLATFNSLFQGVKLLLTLTAAILPGGARQTLWRNVSAVATALLMMFVCITFLSAFLRFITDMIVAPDPNVQGGASLADDGSDPAPSGMSLISRYILVAGIMFAGIVGLRRWRDLSAHLPQRWAEAFSEKVDSGSRVAKMPTPIRPGQVLRGAADSVHAVADIGRDFGFDPFSRGARRAVVAGFLTGGVAGVTIGGKAAQRRLMRRRRQRPAPAANNYANVGNVSIINIGGGPPGGRRGGGDTGGGDRGDTNGSDRGDTGRSDTDTSNPQRFGGRDNGGGDNAAGRNTGDNNTNGGTDDRSRDFSDRWSEYSDPGGSSNPGAFDGSRFRGEGFDGSRFRGNSTDSSGDDGSP